MIAVNHITLTELEWVGVLICIREEIPSKLLADHKLPHDIEGIFVKSNLRKKIGYFLCRIIGLANQMMSISFIKLKKLLIFIANSMIDIR